MQRRQQIPCPQRCVIVASLTVVEEMSRKREFSFQTGWISRRCPLQIAQHRATIRRHWSGLIRQGAGGRDFGEYGMLWGRNDFGRVRWRRNDSNLIGWQQPAVHWGRCGCFFGHHVCEVLCDALVIRHGKNYRRVFNGRHIIVAQRNRHGSRYLIVVIRMDD